MTTMKLSEGPSPQLFFQTVNAHMRTAALKSAIELDVFSAIAEGHRTPKSLAQRSGGSERGLRMLGDFLTVVGFLTKDGDEYRLTPDSELFLPKSSPAYLGPALDFMLSYPFIKNCSWIPPSLLGGGKEQARGAG